MENLKKSWVNSSNQTPAEQIWIPYPKFLYPCLAMFYGDGKSIDKTRIKNSALHVRWKLDGLFPLQWILTVNWW